MDKLKRQKAFEILGKHCPNGINHDGVIDAITEALGNYPSNVELITPYQCHYFDEAQGRNYCINDNIDTKRCTGVKCGYFRTK